MRLNKLDESRLSYQCDSERELRQLTACLAMGLRSEAEADRDHPSLSYDVEKQNLLVNITLHDGESVSQLLDEINTAMGVTVIADQVKVASVCRSSVADVVEGDVSSGKPLLAPLQ